MRLFAALLACAATGCVSAVHYPLTGMRLQTAPREGELADRVVVVARAMTPAEHDASLDVTLEYRLAPGPWAEDGSGDLHTVRASSLPLPSFGVEIQNLGPEPISLEEADIWVDDVAGQRHWLQSDRDALMARALIQVGAELARQGVVPRSYAQWKRPVADKLASLPLLERGVRIPPGGTWRGYASFEERSRDNGPARLGDDAGKVFLRLARVQVGAQRVEGTLGFATRPPSAAVRCADGSWASKPSACKGLVQTSWWADGACVQETVAFKPDSGPTIGHNAILSTPDASVATPLLDGRQARSPSVEAALDSFGPTRTVAARARLLRGVGGALIAGGIAAAGSLLVWMPVAGRPTEAGWSAVGFASVGVGITISVVGARLRNRAIRAYNDAAWTNGFCAHPR